MAKQYTYQYSIPNPITYREFVRDEKHTIMGIIKSQAQILSKKEVQAII